MLFKIDIKGRLDGIMNIELFCFFLEYGLGN